MRVIKWKIFEQITTKKLYYIGPNPTADTIVTRTRDGVKQVLLVQRSEWVAAEPGKWGIPGGFVDTLANRNTKWEEGYETKVHAAKREVQEETGLDLFSLPDEDFKLLGVYDDRNRDPRNDEHSWVEGNTFVVEIPSHLGDDVSGHDDAQAAKWFTLEELNELPKDKFAFDHIDRFIQLGFIK